MNLLFSDIPCDNILNTKKLKELNKRLSPFIIPSTNWFWNLKRDFILKTVNERLFSPKITESYRNWPSADQHTSVAIESMC